MSDMHGMPLDEVVVRLQRELARLREEQARDEAAKDAIRGQPLAWAVQCGPSDECDVRVFVDRRAALAFADLLNADADSEVGEPYVPVALYADVSWIVAGLEREIRTLKDENYRLKLYPRRILMGRGGGT